MSDPYHIGFTYNIKHQRRNATQAQMMREAEFDTPETIRAITDALSSLGYVVHQIEANELAYEKLRALKKKIHLVFNFAEGLRGRDRESQIPAMLEMIGIPYTGGTPLSYALGLNKAKCKEILAYHNIPTPRWQVMKNGNDAVSRNLRFPLIIKPLAEGSSKGIHSDSLVHNSSDVHKRVRRIRATVEGKAIVEEFLEGREFTVGIIGTPFRILPIIEITFGELPQGMPKFDHYEAKWIYDSPDCATDPLVCPARISAELRKKIASIVLESARILGIKDWARFDIRLDKKGVPNILEVNCPPGILPDPKDNSRFPRAARAGGMSFREMLDTVIKSCARRYGVRMT